MTVESALVLRECMFSLFSLLLYVFIDVRLSHLNKDYLLTYLLTANICLYCIVLPLKRMVGYSNVYPTTLTVVYKPGSSCMRCQSIEMPSVCSWIHRNIGFHSC